MEMVVHVVIYASNTLLEKARIRRFNLGAWLPGRASHVRLLQDGLGCTF